MTYLLLITAVALSTVAEYYAIMGLIAIFSGATIPIAVMGIVLGIAKIIVTSWLYHNWKNTPFLMKSYFVVAITILMLLTSMGIFGYLSKAHSEQGVISGTALAEVTLIDEKINVQKENINAARKTLIQLDNQVNAALERTTAASGADRSAALRRSQAKDRASAIADIESAQKEIVRLQEIRAPKAAELRKVEAEVGPIKYIAALIYEEKASEEILEKAVRWVILLIVFVFDPLAVLMFIAYNQNLAQSRVIKRRVIIEEEKLKPIVETHIDEINNSDSIYTKDSINIHLVNPTTGIGRIYEY
jgi:hypothetical protein